MDKKFVENYLQSEETELAEDQIVDLDTTLTSNELHALQIQRIATIQDVENFNGNKMRWWEANFYNTSQLDWEELVDINEFQDEEVNEDGDEFILEDKVEADPEIDNDENLIVCGELVIDLASYEDYSFDSVSEEDFQAAQKKILARAHSEKKQEEKSDNIEDAVGEPQQKKQKQ